MTSHNSAFDARAEISGKVLRLSITVIPANSTLPVTRYRDLSLTALTGTHDERCKLIHESIQEMFGEIIAQEVCDEAVKSVVGELDRAKIS